MNNRITTTLLLLALSSLTSSLHAQASKIFIPGETGPANVIPISISGFSGEAETVLRFDLGALGFDFVAREQADYHLTGTVTDRLEGRLTSRSGENFFARVYTGGPTRTQAHAFANDVVAQIRKTPPIFNTRIAFRRESGRGHEIAVSDFDGFNPIVVTTNASSPAWVPKQLKLFFTSYSGGFADIHSIDLSTGRRNVFAKYPGSNLSPAPSPDGSRVAMILSARGNPNLYVANSDGTNVRQLTTTTGEQSSPAWSPDGREIVFASSHRGGAALYRINADGGEMRRISTVPVTGLLTEPDWSPDGRQIAFTSQAGSRFQVCVVPAAGGEAEVLADGEDPSWAPNSRTLIFVRRQNTQRFLSLLDVPTKRVKDVRQIQGSSSQPSWAK